MLIKQNLVITHPDNFLKADYGYCFSLYGWDMSHDPDYVQCGEIELDINVDTGKIIETISDVIDREIADLAAKTIVLELRKKELLALEHTPT